MESRRAWDGRGWRGRLLGRNAEPVVVGDGPFVLLQGWREAVALAERFLRASGAVKVQDSVTVGPAET